MGSASEEILLGQLSEHPKNSEALVGATTKESDRLSDRETADTPLAGRGRKHPVPNSRLGKLKHFIGLDRAIAFTVLARSWNIFSGVLNVLLIARFLNSIEQGYYYTFSSLVAMQVVFELGFSFVILQLAAHESAQLKISTSGQISGDAETHSRLASVLKKSIRWYSVAACLMGAVLLAVGFRFFSTHRQPTSPLSWQIPWVCLVAGVVFTFQMDPVFSFLEGCGFVAQVARMRFTQAMLGTTLAWIALTGHLGLFAPAGVVAGQAIAGFAFLFSKRRFLVPLLRHEGSHVVNWASEIWPFQWKMAVSFSCSYLIIPLFNPVLFVYKGAAEAGRMGMSVTISLALGNVAYAWMNTKASPFGNLIARRDFDSLDRNFFRTLKQSSVLLLAWEGAFLIALSTVQRYYPHLASRMLSLPIFATLLLAVFFNHILNSEAVYLRAHKREPLLVLSIVVSTLTAASTLLAGRRWGAAGVTVGYLITGSIIYVVGGTLIFIRSRKLWHGSPTTLHFLKKIEKE